MSELLELFCAPVVLDELDREDVLDSEVLDAEVLDELLLDSVLLELLTAAVLELDELDGLELLSVLDELELAVLDELEDELDWSHGGAGGVKPLVLASITSTVASALCPLAYHACSSRFPCSSLKHNHDAPSEPVANLSTSKPMSFPSPERNSIG